MRCEGHSVTSVFGVVELGCVGAAAEVDRYATFVQPRKWVAQFGRERNLVPLDAATTKKV